MVWKESDDAAVDDLGYCDAGSLGRDGGSGLDATQGGASG